jgi:two-component system nitrogen regulation sensor histidine kinase NtrY
LLVRIGADRSDGQPDGFVVTFDDITELQAAQRQSAWADVARRIAHEIKNPLTPIQLSAERLKRRFTKEITSDPEIFAQCADTIVRHVGDIGRMVDEFSRFARMPQPQIKEEDVGRIARDVLVLRRIARPDIVWESVIPERGPYASCDGRQIREALTNLLQNAEDSVMMAEGAGHVSLRVSHDADTISLSVTDNGIGLPAQDREKLTEPYVTHKPKGTGLGLAIVKKIMEDHGGDLVLDDRPDGPGAVAVLTLKMLPQTGKLPDGT